MQASADFSRIGFGEPFGSLLLAEALRDFVAHRKARGLATQVANSQNVETPSTNAISYLRHVGFFKFVGLPFGNAPSEASGSCTYFPITIIARQELLPACDGDLIQDAIVRRSDRLASLVFEDEMKQIMLSYCFREIIRNVFEHANTDYCVVMAQKWGDVVEIGIVDTGRGICASLIEAHQLESPEMAVREAIKPGISRITDAQSIGRWDNSGFGLYIVSELGRQYGSFTISSSGVSLKLDVMNGQPIVVPMTGTGIKLKVNTENADYFPNILKGIVMEGERHIEATTGIKKAASKSSILW